MAELTLEYIKDLERLNPLFADPYIARVGHDHRPCEAIDHPYAHYIGAFIDGELAGAFLIVESGFIEVEAHSLLTRKSLKYSRELAAMCIGVLFSDPGINRITAHVMQGLESARNFNLKLGFQLEGFRRGAFMKNGRPVGCWLLGMTRQDWEGIQ